MDNDKLFKDACEQIDKANKKVLENVKEDEAILECGGMAYYTVKKDELETFSAYVSNDYDTGMIEIIYSENDAEIIEDYINKLGGKAPTGTFYIEFWGRDTQTSYEYDEWDIETSINYKIISYSELNFARALATIKPANEGFKTLLQKLNALKDYMDSVETDVIIKEMRKILYKMIEQTR